MYYTYGRVWTTPSGVYRLQLYPGRVLRLVVMYYTYGRVWTTPSGVDRLNDVVHPTYPVNGVKNQLELMKHISRTLALSTVLIQEPMRPFSCNAYNYDVARSSFCLDDPYLRLA